MSAGSLNQKVFTFNSYKKYLRLRVSERGVLSQLAEAAGCQRSYFSRVLSTEVHLTPDHGFRLCEFWQFTSEEHEYFMTLLEFERAADAKYRRHLQSKLKKLEKTYEDLSLRTNLKLESSEKDLFLYHSSWHWAAIHMLTAVPRFQTVASICKRLNLSEDIVTQSLKHLRSIGYVENQGHRWSYVRGETFISRNSSFLPIFHQNWRLRAVQDSLDLKTDAVHFSNVQSLSEEDFSRLKKMLVDFIDSCLKISAPSPPEEVVAFTFDIFKA